MCARREERDVYQPIADLQQEHINGDIPYPIRDLPFIGPVAYFGLLESV